MTDTRRDAVEREQRDRELEALVGRTIASKYRVTRLIGRGGMGAVYEAEHIGIGRMVAIKFIDREVAKDEGVVTRFAREARVTTAVESEHIVSVFDAGVDAERPYLVMELLRGEDLGSRLRRLGRLPLKESLHIVAQVLRGLARAHEAGIVHRDLKPDNVFLVRRESDPLFVKIVDFGISKMDRPKSGTTPLAITGKGTVLGTPLYMAPEQAQALSDIDGRADIYSAGAILFECLTGRPPHTGECYEQIILAICMQDAPDLRTILPSVPAPVAAFASRALARHRESRFGSAFQALAALREVAPDDPATLLTPAHGEDHSPLSFAATVAMGAPTDVSWSAGSTPQQGAPRITRSRPRGTLRVLATALIAMASGVGITTWLLRHAPTDGKTARLQGLPSAAATARPSATTRLAPDTMGSVRAVVVQEPVVEPAAPPAPVAASETPAIAAQPGAKVASAPPVRGRSSPTSRPPAQGGGARDGRPPPLPGTPPPAPKPTPGGLDLQRDFP